MKQLSPGVGWAIVQGRLLWTNDEGAVWNDITPQGPVTQTIYHPFFLDDAHGWMVIRDGPGVSKSPPAMRIARTEDSGRTWSSFEFDVSSYEGLKNVIASPSSLWFADYQHGWFQWRIQTSSAFSTGKLFSTDDGGAKWTELPDPPSANGIRFHSQQDGWMTGGAAADELWATRDGGRTWETKSVPPPATCRQCRPVYETPRFQSPYNAVVTATFVDESEIQGRHVHSSYVTYDGGNSWQSTEEFEQNGSYPKTGITSSLEMHAVRVFSNAKHGIQIRTGTTTTTSSYPKELPRRGSVAATDFADDSNGWLVYQVPVCNRFRKQATDGPGLPCIEGVLRNDLLATTDGGKTFRVITPSVSSASSQ